MFSVDKIAIGGRNRHIASVAYFLENDESFNDALLLAKWHCEAESDYVIEVFENYGHQEYLVGYGYVNQQGWSIHFIVNYSSYRVYTWC